MTRGKRSDKKDIIINLESPLVQDEREPILDDTDPDDGTGGSNCPIDFLAFGDDLQDLCLSEKRPKKRDSTVQPRHGSTSEQIIATMQERVPAESKSLSKKRRRYTHDFEGQLDDSECQQLEHILTNESDPKLVSSSASPHGDHDDTVPLELPTSDEEEVC